MLNTKGKVKLTSSKKQIALKSTSLSCNMPIANENIFPLLLLFCLQLVSEQTSVEGEFVLHEENK